MSFLWGTRPTYGSSPTRNVLWDLWDSDCRGWRVVRDAIERCNVVRKKAVLLEYKERESTSFAGHS